MQGLQFLRSPSQQLPGTRRRWLNSCTSYSREQRNTVARVLSTPRQTLSRPVDVLLATNSSEQNGKAIDSVPEAVPDVPTERLPRHVAVVMDGNSRWAKQRGMDAAYGHQAGVQSLRRLVEGCSKYGVPALTVFAFSAENWQRPAAELSLLLAIFHQSLEAYLPELQQQGVRIAFIGDPDQLPARLRALMRRAEQETQGNSKLLLTIAMSYGGRQDLVEAAKKLAEMASLGVIDAWEIDAAMLQEQLSTSSMLQAAGPPDLLIRTSGEQRLSNFLLWELAYAELHFCAEMWPDFGEQQLLAALQDYAGRDRRFGRRACS